MEAKLLVIEDDATAMPVMAIRVAARQRAGLEETRAILASAGYGRTRDEQREYVWLAPLHSGRVETDPYQWTTRTHTAAHLVLQDHWRDFGDGGRLDVREYPEQLSRAIRVRR